MRMVRAANKRTGFNMAEAHLQCFCLELRKLTWRIEARHGQMIPRWAQILPDGENVAVRRRKVAEDLKQFMSLFAETHHDARLGQSFRPQLFGVAQQFKRAFVARPGTNHAIEARYGLRIVVQNFRACFDNDADGLAVALKIGDENFNAAVRGLTADFFDHLGKGTCASHEIVIAIDTGDDGKPEAKCSNSLRHAPRLVQVNRLRPALGHGTESAATGTEVAEHHKGGSAVVPALANIRALRALTDCMQIERAGQLLEAVVVLAERGAGLEPVRFGRGRSAHRLNLYQILAWVVLTCFCDEFQHSFIVEAKSRSISGQAAP